MKPLFEVGEEVILWPMINKQYQGTVATISAIEYKDNWASGGPCNGYQFSDFNPIPNAWAREEDLRKKPKGCGQSFDSLMTDLKRPATEPREVETV
ncbi:hypothetical protein KAR91_17110 [Candidatus Pacearchaeota archaeon]|nr:hypothetical protein [Candidatus Pacearchaeota archaeon]